MVFPGGSDGKEPACNAGNLGSISGLGRTLGEGKGSPFQYSYLENSMDWWTKRNAYSPWGWLFSQTRLSNFHFHFSYSSGSEVKHSPAMKETWVQFLGQEDPLEKEMATHSSILSWIISWTEEPGGSIGLKRVRHNWATNTSLSH